MSPGVRWPVVSSMMAVRNETAASVTRAMAKRRRRVTSTSWPFEPRTPQRYTLNGTAPCFVKGRLSPVSGHAGLVDLCDEVMDRPLDALVGTEDSVIVDLPDWHQVTTPSFASGGLNGIARCRLAEAKLEQRIDRAITGYSGIRWRWTVGANDTPGLAERLRARGLSERSVIGLWRANDLSVPDSAEVVEARSADEVTAFSAVMAEGWSAPLAPMLSYNARLARTPMKQRLFLARVDGEPAGSAGVAIVERSIYLIGAVVLPRFRGHGVYRALLKARFSLARSLGKAVVTCQANPSTSGPILQALGFQSVGTFPVFGPT